jgi:transcriptional regulator with XRE-family HTH domain
MLIQQNFLRVTRKRTHLTQADIASVLKISDFANVYRWERGIRRPGIEVLLAYQLLFDIPIESLFARQKQEVLQNLVTNIKDHIDSLETMSSNPKIQSRIDCLGSILTRLTS